MKRFCAGLLLLLFPGFLLPGGDTLTVLAVADTHGSAGWKLLAPLIAKERSRAGEDVLLIDAGDTLYGSFPGAFRNGEIPLALLNRLHFDVWLPGNHDFEGRPYRFGEFRGTVLGNSWETPDLVPESWKMFRRAGKNIAVIGASESALARRHLPQDGVRFHDPEAALGQAVREALHSGADYLILVRHDGLYHAGGSLYALLKRYPEIHLVIAAHTHEAIAGKKIGNTWIIQPGSHAQMLAVASITFPVPPEKPQVRSELKRPDPGEQWEPDPEFQKLWGAMEEAGKEILGVVPGGLAGASDRDFSGTLGDLVEEALKNATRAAAVIHVAKMKDLSSPETVTARSLFPLIPYQSRIATVRLLPQELTEVVRDLLKFRKKREEIALRFGGMKIFCDKRGLLQKVLLPPPEADGRITVALTSYELTGGGSRTSPLPGWIASGRVPCFESGLLLRDEVARCIAKKYPRSILSEVNF